MREPAHHISVLETTVLDILRPQPGEVVLDVTLGLGGHALRFLEATGSSGRLIGLDADADNLSLASERLNDVPNADLRHANFRTLADLDLPRVDILFADLGLSSPHLDEPERGFTFRMDAPLDMRFDRTRGLTASQLIAESDEDTLTRIFREYGELREARHLARNLAGITLSTTFALKSMVEQLTGYKAPALLPRIFQALRIAVNDELHALEQLLLVGPQLLLPGGRMGVISFHSLEDRMVKQTFRTLSTPEKDPVTGKVSRTAPFQLLTKKPAVPSDSETSMNPRSRSAKFRAIARVG